MDKLVGKTVIKETKKESGNEEVKFKKGEIGKIILAVLGIGIVLGGSVFITPNFPIVLGGLLKLIEEARGIKIPRLKMRRALEKLEKRKIISLEKKGKEVYVKVLDKWNSEMIKYSIESILALKKKKKWSQKWFMVVFDIPEEEKNKREFLRGFLKQVGFFPYQKSIYVYPYECEKEVELMKKIVEGGKYIRYIIAEKIEEEKKLKRVFAL